MRTSKYFNRTFDNGWVCTHVGVARVQPKNYSGTRIASLRPGHQTYYYVFERITSDSKADKMIRLTAAEAARVYRGEISVETIARQRLFTAKNTEFTKKISYHFYNRKAN